MRRSTSLLCLSLLFSVGLFGQTASKPNSSKPASPAQSPGRAKPQTSQRYDLSGLWQADSGKAGTAGYRSIKLGLEQEMEDLTIAIVDINSSKTLLTLFQGDYVSGNAIRGKIASDWSDSGEPLKWTPATMVIDDNDHMRIGNSFAMRRIPPDGAAKHCDPSKDSHIKPYDAYFNNSFAAYHYDYQTANCWARIGALLGDPGAQGSLGYNLLVGRGIPRNSQEAMIWLQKGADGHDFYAELNLAKVYHFGWGVPVDPTKADHWMAMAQKDKGIRRNTYAENIQIQAAMEKQGQAIINDVIDKMMHADCRAHVLRSMSDGYELDDGTKWHSWNEPSRDWVLGDHVVLCFHDPSGFGDDTLTDKDQYDDAVVLRTF